jgi:hypothetical protein
MPKEQKRDFPLSPTPNNNTTPVYRIESKSKGYQDSMMAYNKVKGKAAGAETLKPKGPAKTYVKDIPTSSIKVKKK